MRINRLFVLTLTLFASCSVQKYVYAQHTDYKGNRKKIVVEPARQVALHNVDKTPLQLNAEDFTASTDKKIILTQDDNKDERESVASAKASAKIFRAFSKTQRKEFRRALRADMKRYMIPKH